jgi:hypothetical protein
VISDAAARPRAARAAIALARLGARNDHRLTSANTVMAQVANRSIPTCMRSFVIRTTADSAVAKYAVLSQPASTAVAPSSPCSADRLLLMPKTVRLCVTPRMTETRAHAAPCAPS